MEILSLLNPYDPLLGSNRLKFFETLYVYLSLRKWPNEADKLVEIETTDNNKYE